RHAGWSAGRRTRHIREEKRRMRIQMGRAGGGATPIEIPVPQPNAITLMAQITPPVASSPVALPAKTWLPASSAALHHPLAVLPIAAASEPATCGMGGSLEAAAGFRSAGRVARRGLPGEGRCA